mgnify:CR=1 FL=1
MKSEPLALITAIVTAISIGIDTAIQFGWDLTADQTSALNKLFTALAAIAIVAFVRPKVTPVNK